MPDTPDILRGLLAADRTRRARSVRDLYRLLLDQERLFPATAPAALVVAALLDDPRTLAEDRWERRAGTRPLRAELLNWLANFADLARHDVRDGVGTPQDLAAARAVRPALHARVAPFCENEDPRVREAAVAATALLLADLVLAASVPRHAPAVRDVLAPSADSYYRWIARERLEAWGEGSSDLLAVEQERRAAAGRAHALARDPFDEGGERAARWPAGQPEDTAALEPPGRWHPARAAVERAAPPGPAPEPPTAVRGAKPDRRSPWQTTMPHHDEWTFTPYIGVGPLHLGMSLQEIAATLRETGTVLSTYDPGNGEHSLTLAEFPTTGIRALFGRSNGLACVAVGAQNGPPGPVGRYPADRRPAARGGEPARSPTGPRRPEVQQRRSPVRLRLRSRDPLPTRRRHRTDPTALPTARMARPLALPAPRGVGPPVEPVRKHHHDGTVPRRRT
ncbi:hypothetical protein GCM10010519_76250 [Streptomyces lactacystinicus]